MFAGLPESTVSFGELRRSVPCFCERARIAAATLNSPTKPVMFAMALAVEASATLPGMLVGETGTVRLAPPVLLSLITSAFEFDVLGNALTSGRVTPLV